jgi:hypothetical protein
MPAEAPAAETRLMGVAASGLPVNHALGAPVHTGRANSFTDCGGSLSLDCRRLADSSASGSCALGDAFLPFAPLRVMSAVVPVVSCHAIPAAHVGRSGQGWP